MRTMTDHDEASRRRFRPIPSDSHSVDGVTEDQILSLRGAARYAATNVAQERSARGSGCSRYAGLVAVGQGQSDAEPEAVFKAAAVLLP